MKKKNDNKDRLRLIFKFLFAAIFTNILICFIIFFAKGGFNYENDDYNKADYVNFCNKYYYSGQYGKLAENLELFDLYDDEFGIYWEIADGYADYVQYVQWSSVTDEELAGSSEKAEKYRQKVIDNAENCKFEMNKSRLDKFADECKEISINPPNSQPSIEQESTEPATTEQVTIETETTTEYVTTEPETTTEYVTTEPETTTEAVVTQPEIVSQNYLVKVNVYHNCITVYSQDAAGEYTVPVKAIVCSTGRSGCETPLGTYKTSAKWDWAVMGDGTYTQYVYRFNGPYLFHSVPYFTKAHDNLEYEEFNKLGEPASAGCVRMCAIDAKWIYDNVAVGSTVVIYSDETSPGPLGKPEMIKIPLDSPHRGWDPTDPNANNPWKK